MKNRKVTINGQTVDLDDVADAANAQALLVPDNWKGKKADCVHLFLACQEMLAFQLRRHLAHNWKDVCKIAENQKARGIDKGARVAISFAFEIDQTAPTVAALTKLNMDFSEKYSTKGKPITKDLAQLDLFGEEGSTVVIDAGISAEQEADKEAEDKEAKAEQAKKDAVAKKHEEAEKRKKDAERKRAERAEKKASKPASKK